MTYSASVASNRRRYNSRNQNSTSFSSGETQLGPVSNTIILIVMACLLGMLYLTQVTKTNSFGYDVNELRNSQASLEQEHAELEVAAARLQAIGAIEKKDSVKKLVSARPSGSISN